MKRTLLVLPLVLLGAGCNAPSAPTSRVPNAPADIAPATPAATTGNAAAETFCTQKKNTFATYQAKWDDKRMTLGLPGSFPAMPEGAILCGTAPDTHQAYYYYSSARPQKEVMDGFINAFKAAGWKTDSTISDRMSFNNGIPFTDAGAKFGGINYDTSGVELILTYRTK